MLEILSKSHKVWVAMGLSLGIPSDLVEDFVHETYLRLNKYIDDPKKIMYNEKEINKFYVYVTIKNLWNDYNKAKSRYITYRIDNYDTDYYKGTPDWAVYEEVDLDKEKAQEELLSRIDNEVDSWDYWYDQKLFRLYYKTDISMRKLAQDTRISVTSIFNSCKNYKEILKSKFSDDFKNYLAGDFSSLKKEE